MPGISARTASMSWLVLAMLWFPSTAAAQPAPPDGVAALIRRLEQATAAGDLAAVLALGDPAISRPSFEDFAITLTKPAPSRVVMNERDRAPLGGRAQRLIVEI